MDIAIDEQDCSDVLDPTAGHVHGTFRCLSVASISNPALRADAVAFFRRPSCAIASMSPPEVAAMRSDTVAAGNGDATTSGEADGECVAQAFQALVATDTPSMA